MTDQITRPPRRGFWGWLWLILWALFNLAALALVALTFVAMGDLPATTSEAEAAGQALGSGLFLGALIAIWLAGTVILGLPVLLTRPR